MFSFYAESSYFIQGGLMIKINCRPVVATAGNVDLSKLIGRFAKFLHSFVSCSAILVRGAALVLTAAAPLALSTNSALAVCTETAVGSGIFACTGADVATLTPTSAVGGDLVVTTTAPFSVITGAGDAFVLSNAGGDVGISFTDSNASTVITGFSRGIDANNNGTGALSIETSGSVTGLNFGGIDATNAASATNLSITVNAGSVITGNSKGIDADNNGTGALSIVTSGSVTGLINDGIEATNAASATNLSITVNAGSVVTGNLDGIDADNNGTGTSMITINGTVSGATSEGIDFDDSTASGAVTIIVGETGVVTSGTNDAIATNSDGVGDQTVNINGRLVGDNDGLDLDKDGTGNIIVVAGVGSFIQGLGNEGIETDITTTGGTTTITANGTVIANEHGIEADNDGDSGFITITTGAGSSVTAGFDGINADNDGTGALTINAGGTITAGRDGIEANSVVAQPIAITVSGTTTGGTGFGILTVTGAMGMTTITLNAGANISATSGQGISNDAGDSTTTVNSGASVAGTITLGDGSDNLIFAGGSFAGVTLFDGGDDMSPADTFIDTLTFAGSSGAVTGANVVNWENVVIGAGSTISFSDNMVTTGEFSTSAGGTLSATAGTLMITANVTNNGTVSLQDGTADDRVEVSGNYSGTGALNVDVNLATNTSDVLAVGGNVTGGATTITANYLSPTSANGANILVVDVTGTSGASDFSLGNPISGAFAYGLSQIGVDWFLQQTGFNPATPTYEVYPQVLANLNQMPSLQQRTGNRKTTDGTETSAALGYAPVEEKSKTFALFDNLPAEKKPTIWGRIEGSKSTVDSSTSTTGASFDTRSWNLQAGVDGKLPIDGEGQVFVGINGSLGRANTDVNSATGNGFIHTDSYGLGLTATWYNDNGFYVDAQARIVWFSSDLSDDATGALVNNNHGYGRAFSIEAGKSFDVGNDWILTPQAQLMSSSVSFNSFTGPNGAVVSSGDVDSITGRLGARIERNSTSDAGQSTIYALANIYSRFSGDSRVDVSGVSFNNTPDKWTGEIGAGGSVDVGSFKGGQVSLYGQGTIGTSLSNFGDSNQYKALAGIKVSF